MRNALFPLDFGSAFFSPHFFFVGCFFGFTLHKFRGRAHIAMSFVCDEQIAKLFPLRSISDVVQFFRVHLESAREPDLTLLSIVTGMIENTLTRKCPVISSTHSDGNTIDAADPDLIEHTAKTTATDAPTAAVINFPVVYLDEVQQLYDKFVKVISLVGECKRVGDARATKSGRISANHNKAGSAFATREIIKQCSDVIWHSLIRSTYKDRAHLQSLYSYLAGNKLDCFGVAFAVVAGCQLLGYADVHLAISEDHAWVVFGKTGDDTIEVTWHGKGASSDSLRPSEFYIFSEFVIFRFRCWR